MTPKEKAYQIWESMWLVKDQQGIASMNKQSANECALICVDEIIKQLQAFPNNISVHIIPYWQEVKKEIENL